VFVGNMLDTPFGWVLVALLIFAIAVFIGCITGSTSYDDTSSAVATAQVNQTSVDPSTPRSAPHISEHTQENPVVRPRAGIELARLS
jgi:hypothetical protein